MRKSYEEKRRRRRQKGQQQRPWRLKRLAVDAGDEEGAPAAEKERGGRGRVASSAEQEQADMERFMQVRGAGGMQ